ncbi:hypothetical protein B0I35DRAFT_122520 [Stachybotrys elegans]|uniref:Extracellular membrane protein CFEM domain-containing protein n=1 Tax=Stachybotrys elegans TaxID=80388 RepID=A0A8K0SVG8_9HYPO|nr:hypothetical protein B0I35DRAFT_122520 [Stachybotrys elegans]
MTCVSLTLVLFQMLLDTMARKPSTAFLILSLAALSSAQVHQPGVRDEVARFIPACAQACFRSFLAVNYGIQPCGPLPSLQCICSSRGASGFTVGEGAVQCISAERAFGSCSPEEATTPILLRAFNMCDGQDGAVEPTNDIITATVLLPTSGTGPVTFAPIVTTSVSSTQPPPVTSTTSTSTTTRPTSSLVSTSTSTSSRSSPPTTTTTTTTTLLTTTRPPPASTTPAGGVPPGQEDEANSDDQDDGLNTQQIVGISVGAGAAAIIALLAIFLSRYWRKKNYPGVKTGFFTRDTWRISSAKKLDNESSTWLAQQITAPLDPNPSPAPPPKVYNRTSWRPDAIGLAISPPQYRETETPPPQRRESRLLPAKPVFSPPKDTFSPSGPSSRGPSPSGPQPQPSGQLAPGLTSGQPPRGPSPRDPSPQLRPSPSRPTPQPSSPSVQRPERPKLQIPTQSDLTSPPRPRLALNERDSTMTEFEEDETRSLSPNQIWRLPSAGPLSATTYYVADKYGNWVLGDPKRASQLPQSPPAVVSPTAAEPKSVAADARFFQARPVASQPAPRPPQQPSLAPAAQITPLAGPTRSSSIYSQQSSVPRPLFTNQPNPRYSAVARRSMPKPLTRPRAESAASDVTTITTSSEDSSSDPSPPAEQPPNLSPVAESPYSGSGRSPVSYPKINGRRQSAGPRGSKDLKVLPAIAALRYSPPGQPSPTLGMLPPRGPPQNPPRPSPLGASGGGNNVRTSIENPGLIRNGSPTMRMVRPSPEPTDDRDKLPSAQSQPQPEPQLPRLDPQLPSIAQYPPYGRQYQSSSSSSGPWLPPNGKYRPLNPSYAPQPIPKLVTSGLPPPPTTTDYQSPPISERTISTSSSLLAKRIGSDRAANMAIPTNSSDPRWRRDNLLSPDAAAMASAKRTGDLPATPIWVPRLTPTRRGDDLFLNVQ